MRAVTTAAQAAIALIGTNAMGVTDVDWIAVASAAGLAAVVSLLTSVTGLPEVEAEVKALEETDDEPAED